MPETLTSQERDTWQIGFFCDFDGTISENDMIAQIMMEFAPEQAQPMIRQVTNRTLSIREGVERMFALIPSSQYEEVRRFAVETAKIRAGFAEFVEQCSKRGWLLAVVSGGFDFFVEPVLAPYRSQLDVYCSRIDASGPFLQVQWSQTCDNECSGGCGLCKPTILRRFDSLVNSKVVVGDGVTDIEAALRADFVFARERLLKECRIRGLPHSPFNDFYDILGVLNNPNAEVFQHVK